MQSGCYKMLQSAPMPVNRTKKSTNPISGLKKIRFWSRKWLVELVGSGPPLIAAVAGAFTLSDPSGVWSPVLIVASVWLLGASGLKIKQAYDEDKSIDRDNEHHGITACLHVLHATLEHHGKVEYSGTDPTAFDLRVTFHRVVEPLDDPKELEQLVDYVGGRGGGKGRMLNVQSGITGQAVRENNVFMMDRDVQDVEEYRRILVSDWHYRKSEADKLTADRFSAIAVPITSKSDENLVLGVVYMDSKMENFFNRVKLQECVVNCCTGLTRFIGERYD